MSVSKIKIKFEIMHLSIVLLALSTSVTIPDPASDFLEISFAYSLLRWNTQNDLASLEMGLHLKYLGALIKSLYFTPFFK